MILRKAGEHSGRESNIDGGSLASKLVQYSSLLASQGCLETALNFLGESSNDPSISALRERLYYSLRHTEYRPTRAQIAPRSRQSSESRGNVGKRPSYPNHNAMANPLFKRNSSELLNSTDFSNLTGPVHPPTGPAPGYYGSGPATANPYGNLYVNSSIGGNNAVGPYSPALSSGGSSNYGGSGVQNLPRPPSTSIYNPLGVIYIFF
jgi:hypothetical protein